MSNATIPKQIRSRNRRPKQVQPAPKVLQQPKPPPAKPLNNRTAKISRQIFRPTKPHLGSAGLEWLAASLNPMRSEHAVKDISPRYPDGSRNTITLVLTAQSQHAGLSAADGYCWIGQNGGSTTQLLNQVWGGSAINPASSPTGRVSSTVRENVAAYPYLSTASTMGCRSRMIAAGLKVQFIGSLTHGAGRLRGGWIRNHCLDGAASFHTYNDMYNGMSLPLYEVRDGITVSMPFDPTMLIFREPIGNYYDHYQDAPLLPAVQFSGLEASTSSILLFSAVMFMEVEVPPCLVPHALSAPVGERDLATLVAYSNNANRISSGNTFPSVLKQIAGSISDFFEFTQSHPKITSLVTGFM